MEKGRAPEPSMLNSNSQPQYEDLQYSNEDIKHIEDWVKRAPPLSSFSYTFLTYNRPR